LRSEQDAWCRAALMLSGPTDPQLPGQQEQFAEQRRAWQKIAIFIVLLILFAGSLALARLLVPFGTKLVLSTWTPFLADMLGMWSVGLAGLIALALIDNSMLGVGLGLPARKYLIAGCAVPIIYCVAIYLPVWLLAPQTFEGATMLLIGTGSCLIHLPRSLFAAAGEELGWRGVLVPNLSLVAPPAVVSLAPGALWAVWHYPDILFFGYNVGTPAPFALVSFSIGLVGIGAFLSWIRLASGSLWPAIIFHGVHNSVIWGVFERATNRGGTTAYITTEFGAAFALVGIVVGYASIRCGVKPDLRVTTTCASG
jgi:membrane protease YdiL (CAAX protease family)